MTSFQMLRKKTPFQKHREEEEARKKVSWVGSLVQSCSMTFCFSFWSWYHKEDANEKLNLFKAGNVDIADFALVSESLIL
jgi:hypothetical protein